MNIVTTLAAATIALACAEPLLAQPPRHRGEAAGPIYSDLQESMFFCCCSESGDGELPKRRSRISVTIVTPSR
jgi:hypothetical protein